MGKKGKKKVGWLPKAYLEALLTLPGQKRGARALEVRMYFYTVRVYFVFMVLQQIFHQAKNLFLLSETGVKAEWLCLDPKFMRSKDLGSLVTGVVNIFKQLTEDVLCALPEDLFLAVHNWRCVLV